MHVDRINTLYLINCEPAVKRLPRFFWCHFFDEHEGRPMEVECSISISISISDEDACRDGDGVPEGDGLSDGDGDLDMVEVEALKGTLALGVSDFDPLLELR